MTIELKTASEKLFTRISNEKGGRTMGFDKGAYWQLKRETQKKSILREMKKIFAFPEFIRKIFEPAPAPFKWGIDCEPFTLTAAQRSNFKRIAIPKRKLIHSRSLSDRLIRRQKHADRMRSLRG